MSNEQKPLLTVLGPTASGKTALAVALGKTLNGEIISADSMQVYKQVSVATAQPSMEEQCGIPHHLLGILELSEMFSVADFVMRARSCIDEIAERKSLPILVGGTGLYIDAVIDHIVFPEKGTDPVLRQELLSMAPDKLHKWLSEVDPGAAVSIHPNNINRVVRALEVSLLTGRTIAEQNQASRLEPSPYNSCVIGLNFRNRELLYNRINKRVDMMLENGLEKEAYSVFKSDNVSPTASQIIGIKEFFPYFCGSAPLSQCIEGIKQHTRHYAKRQLTWFRRRSNINWIYLDEMFSFEAVIDESKKICGNFFDYMI